MYIMNSRLRIVLSACGLFYCFIAHHSTVLAQPGTRLWGLVDRVKQSSQGAQIIVETMNTVLQTVNTKSTDIKAVTDHISNASLAKFEMVLSQLDQVVQEGVGHISAVTEQLTDILEQTVANGNNIAKNTSALDVIVGQGGGSAPSCNVCSRLDALETTVTNEFNNLNVSDAKTFSKLDALETTVANDFNNLNVSNAKTFSKLDALETTVTNEFNNLNVSDAKTFSKLDALETTVANDFNNLNVSNAKTFSKLDVLETTVANDFNNLNVSNAKTFSKLDALETTVANDFNNLNVSNAKTFSKLDALETTVANDFNNLNVSNAKTFSKLDALETTVTNEFSNLNVSDAKTFSKLDALETTVANDFNNLSITDVVIQSKLDLLIGGSTSPCNICSTLEVLETTVKNDFQDLDGSVFEIISKLDGLETTVIDDLYNISLVQNTILSKVEIGDMQLAYGITALYKKLVSIEPLKEPFLISQHTIGQGDTFVISQPGYYKLSESILFDTGTAIQITANNVVLDLNGMSIDGGLALNALCIMVSSAECISIRNGSLLGAQGIVLYGAYDATVQDIIGCHNASGLLSVFDSHQVFVQNCIVSHTNTGSGFIVDSVASEVTLKNCSATACAGHGYQLGGSNIVLSDSVAQANTGAGIFCAEISHAQILTNIVQGNETDGISLNTAILDVQCISNRIMGNTNIGLNALCANSCAFLNNLSTNNGVEDYFGVKAVATSKATSYWHNVHG
jgi:hypothetical protein